MSNQGNASISSSDASFDPVTFTARTLVALAKLSIEVVEDSYNIVQLVANSIAKSLSLELDRVALYGSGTPKELKDVENQSGISTAALGSDSAGSLADYSPFNTAVSRLMGKSNNVPGRFGIIISPRTAGELSALQDTLYQPLRKPRLVEAAQFFNTSQIPNALTVGGASVVVTPSLPTGRIS